mmetsp:Transcript_17090/g.25607  ORF Transcript_17090/g.25607 Transcript_17090/m.25607 type:complete len:213 (+) Transcript_17090:46-684(+)
MKMLHQRLEIRTRILHQNAGLAILSHNRMLFDPRLVRQVTSKLGGHVSTYSLDPVSHDLAIQKQIDDTVKCGALLAFRTNNSIALVWETRRIVQLGASRTIYSVTIFRKECNEGLLVLKLLLDGIEILLHFGHHLLLFHSRRYCLFGRCSLRTDGSSELEEVHVHIKRLLILFDDLRQRWQVLRDLYHVKVFQDLLEHGWIDIHEDPPTLIT